MIAAGVQNVKKAIMNSWLQWYQIMQTHFGLVEIHVFKVSTAYKINKQKFKVSLYQTYTKESWMY